MEHTEAGQQPAPIGEAMPMGAPTQPQTPPMAAPEPQPTPMPAPAPATPAAEPQQMQQQAAPEVEQMEMSMQPIDLSGQQEMAMPQTSSNEGSKKRLFIIIGVIIAGLVVGVVAFFIWRANQQQPVEQIPAAGSPSETSALPNEIPALPTTTQQVVAPAPDDITVIEQDLSAFGTSTIDTELQNNLNSVNSAL